MIRCARTFDAIFWSSVPSEWSHTGGEDTLCGKLADFRRVVWAIGGRVRGVFLGGMARQIHPRYLHGETRERSAYGCRHIHTLRWKAHDLPQLYTVGQPAGLGSSPIPIRRRRKWQYLIGLVT